MRQKYLIQRDDENNTLNIKEYANLDRIRKGNVMTVDNETFSLLGQETYDETSIAFAIKKGKDNLVAALRTHNLYPIGTYAEKIASSVMKLYGSNNHHKVELLFDDNDFFERPEET